MNKRTAKVLREISKEIVGKASKEDPDTPKKKLLKKILEDVKVWWKGLTPEAKEAIFSERKL